MSNTVYSFRALGTDRAGQLVEISGRIEGESGFPQSVREAVRDYCAGRGVTVSLHELGTVLLRDLALEQRQAYLRANLGRDRRDE